MTVTPVNPSFLYIKWDSPGCSMHEHVIVLLTSMRPLDFQNRQHLYEEGIYVAQPFMFSSPAAFASDTYTCTRKSVPAFNDQSFAYTFHVFHNDFKQDLHLNVTNQSCHKIRYIYLWNSFSYSYISGKRI